MRSVETRSVPVVLTLPAEIGPANLTRVYDRLYAAFVSGGTVVIADLSATTFCDSPSLRRLIDGQRRAAAQNAQLRFVIPPGSRLRRLAQISHLDRAVQIYPSRGEASADGEVKQERPVSILRAVAGGGQADPLITLSGETDSTTAAELSQLIADQLPDGDPPRVAIRSAVSSTMARTASTCGSSIVCTAMKFGPITFQCTCLRVSARSLSEFNRSWSSLITRSALSFLIPGTV
jgi:anti-sigma B factor antagonist